MPAERHLLQDDTEGGNEVDGVVTRTCGAFCVTVIDYLMEYSVLRKIESWWKENRWHNYADKTLQLW